MGKKYDPTSPREIRRLKKLFAIPEAWAVAVAIHEDEDADCAGQSVTIPPYQRALIDLWPEVIERVSADFPDETLKSVLYHEFGEMVASMYSMYLPDKIRRSPEVMAMRDGIAEHIRRIVEGLEL